LPPDDGWTSLGGKPQLVHATGTGQGENIWAGGANYYSTADMVNSWASEKNNWNGDAKTCASGKVCGHYTQMVWRTTTDVGCATAIGNQGKFEFLVCRYSPPGNYNGQSPY
jgi:pathogenesis-related protein 1